MKPARACHRLELATDLRDAFVNEPAVGLDLGLAGTAQETETATLPLEMGPGAHETRSLPGEMRKFDLQRPFLCAGPFTENLENETGAVDDLRPPGPLEIALLHRGEGRVDDHQIRPQCGNLVGDLRDLAAPQEGRGVAVGERHESALEHRHIDRMRKAGGLREAGLGHTVGRPAPAQRRLHIGVENNSPHTCCRTAPGPRPVT